jgi:pimeloyl-ACP methyl ester carboxylesterase
VPSTVELSIDVTDAAGLGMPAHQAVTVHLPAPGALADPPVVCFVFPGGGYSRQYYSFDMPDGSGGGQAGWHAERGWIVVAVDHLGVGESTVPEGNLLNYENVARGNKAVVETIMERIEEGTLADGFPAIQGATKLGLGQSMGGCFTIVLQGQHDVFDGIGALGFSAIQTVVPGPPWLPQPAWPWMPRGTDLDNPVLVNAAALMEAAGPTIDADAIAEASDTGQNPLAWAFHWDDEPADVVAADSAAPDGAELPVWRSATTPPCAILMVAPGTVAPEAAAIRVPVMVAVGERDVVPDPWMEPKAFKSATDITVFVCPRMGHMHNFAHTRHRFWERLHQWGTGVAAMKGAAS